MFALAKVDIVEGAHAKMHIREVGLIEHCERAFFVFQKTAIFEERLIAAAAA